MRFRFFSGLLASALLAACAAAGTSFAPAPLSKTSERPAAAGVAFYVSNTTLGQVDEGSASGSLKVIGSHFNDPMGLVADANANVYVADSANGAVRKIAPNGKISLVAKFGEPSYLALDRSGNLFVSDDATGNVFKLSRSGERTIVGKGWFSVPHGLATDRLGNLYVGDSSYIWKVTAAGKVVELADFGSIGVAVDRARNVYYIVPYNHAVGKITPAGKQSILARGFYGLSAIAVDASSNVYVTDESPGLVKKIAPGGAVTVVAKGLYDPEGIAAPAW